MKDKLLELCGYSNDAKSIELVERISKNYSHFDEVVQALTKLQPFLAHSDYYLSLMSDRDMIKIKKDSFSDDEESFDMIDSEIIVWANQNAIELEEGLDEVCILGLKSNE